MIPQGVDLDIVIDNNLDQYACPFPSLAPVILRFPSWCTYRCCWQLSQFKKYSQPTRLADAVHDLEFVVRRLGTRRDVIPRYTLAAALARTPGREDEAARMFDAIMPALNRMEDGQVSAIWARAEWARFLRRRGEAEKAEKQEQWLRDVSVLSKGRPETRWLMVWYFCSGIRAIRMGCRRRSLRRQSSTMARSRTLS